MTARSHENERERLPLSDPCCHGGHYLPLMYAAVGLSRILISTTSQQNNYGIHLDSDGHNPQDQRGDTGDAD